MVRALGGRVEGAERGEFGRTELSLVDEGGRLMSGLPETQQCWMSHRDCVFEPPPGFSALASSPGSPVAACEDTERGPLRHPVPSRGRPHTPRPGDPRALPARGRRLRGAVVGGVGDRRADRPDPRAGRRRRRHLRAVRRRRLGHRRGARPRGDRRPAHLRPRRPRPAPQGRGRAGRRDLPRGPRHQADPRRRPRALPRPARRSRRARAQAQDHRRGVHPRLRGGGAEAPRRQPPRPGHALLGRDRVRRRHRRRDDQVAPQRRRPARGPRVRARRAAADALQGRGPRRRLRARPLRPDGLAPALPGPRPGDPDRRRRGQRGAPRDPPRSRRRSSRRRSVPPASIATSGSPSASFRSSARSASRATAAPTPTRS